MIIVRFFRSIGGPENRFQHKDIVSYKVGEITIYGFVLSPEDCVRTPAYIPDINRVKTGLDVCLYASTGSYNVVSSSILVKVDPKSEIEVVRRERKFGWAHDVGFLEKYL